MTTRDQAKRAVGIDRGESARGSTPDYGPNLPERLLAQLGPVPDGYRWSLPLLYLVFALCVLALWIPCRWYARVRAERRSRWLSYL